MKIVDLSDQLESRLTERKQKAEPTSSSECLYAGELDDGEARLALENPREFLHKAGVDVPDDAQIHVRFNTVQKARIGVGHLCRVTIRCIGPICIISIECIPVIVIACW